jgi:hypothetical protein
VPGVFTFPFQSAPFQATITQNSIEAGPLSIVLSGMLSLRAESHLSILNLENGCMKSALDSSRVEDAAEMERKCA